jgi:hypothetical protein
MESILLKAKNGWSFFFACSGSKKVLKRAKEYSTEVVEVN